MMKTPRRTAAPDIIPGPSRLQRCVHVFAAVSLFLASTVSAASAQQAEPQIVVDPHAGGPEPTLDKTQNGIDQVNIATPNAAGVSHNDFIQYGVPESGVILNNATTATETKIGGVVYGNTNLDGHAASLILNEVTGTLPTQMLGYTEVAGHQASVVVANPNGITCAGCGFINTAHVTLATGTPEMDASGNLKDIVVKGGNITFSGQGGDFTTVPVLDILSRSVTLKAQVNAETATIVAGRNRVDYGTNAAHPLASDGTAAPEFAIDTAALGGMYANRIYMVVNEAGAGVRVDGTMAANAGDMTLTDAGDLVLNGSMAASGNLQAQVGGQVSNAGTLQSGGGMQLAAGGALNNSGTIGGGTTLAARAAAIGNSGTVTAGAGALSLAATGALDNSGGIGASGGALSARAGSLANTGTIAARTGLTLASGSTLSNAGGQISSTTGLASIAAVGALDNTGGKILDQSGDMTLSAQAVTNNGGAIQAGGSLTAALASYTSDTTASLTAQQALAVTATGAVDNEGTLGGGTGVSVTADHIANGASALLVATAGNLTLNAAGTGGLANTGIIKSQSASGSLTIDAATLANSDSILAAGTLGVRTAGTVTSTGTLYGAAGLSLAAGGVLSNRGGQLGSDTGVVQLAAASLDNTGGKIIATDGGLNIDAASVANNNGWLQAAALMSIVTTTLDNTGGTVLGGTSVTLARDATGAALDHLTNASGLVEASNDLTISAVSVDNTSGGLVGKTGSVAITDNGSGQGLFTNTDGAVQAGGALTLATGQYASDTSAALQAGTALDLSVTGAADNEGAITAGDGLSLSAASLVNGAKGTIGALAGDTTIAVHGNAASPALSNAGAIEDADAAGVLKVDATSLANTGTIISQGNQSVDADGLLLNSGEIASLAGSSALSAAGLTNSGLIATAAGLDVSTTDDLLNTGTLYGATGLTLGTGGTTSNQGGTIGTGAAGALAMTAAQVANDNGTIQAGTSLALSTAGLDNEAGTILAGGAIGIRNGDATTPLTALDNRGGAVQAGGNLTIVAAGLANTAGTLVSVGGNVTLSAGAPATLMATLDNTSGGIIQAAGSVSIAAGTIGNDNGRILALDGNIALDADSAPASALAFSNAGGAVKAAGNLSLVAGTWSDDATGVMSAGQDLSVVAAGDMAVAGTLVGGQGLGLTAAGLTTAASGLMATENGVLALVLTGTGSGDGLSNAGRIEAEGRGATLDVTTQAALANGGTLVSQGDVTLAAQGVTNSGEIGALAGLVDINAASLANTGTLVASDQMNATLSGSVSNSGLVYGTQGVTLKSGGAIDDTDGRIGGNGAVALSGASLTNTSGAVISGAGTVSVTTTGAVGNEGGAIQGAGDVVLAAASLDNTSAGRIVSTGGTLDVGNAGGGAMAQLANDGGALQAGQDITLVADSLTNGSGGLVNAADGSLLVSAGGTQAAASINNAGGTLQSWGDLTLVANGLDNDGGSVIERSGQNTLSLANAGGGAMTGFSDTDGVVQAAGNLSLDATSLGGAAQLVAGNALAVTLTGDLDSGMLFQSGGDTLLRVGGDYTAEAGGGVLAGGNATITAASVTNNGALMAEGGVLDVSSGGAITNTGLVDGVAGVALDLPGTLTNQLGAILSDNGSIGIGNGASGAAAAVFNRSGEIVADSASGDVLINAGTVTNDVLGGVTVVANAVLWSHSYAGGSNVDIPVPAGLLDTVTGAQGTGQLVGHSQGGTIYVQEDGGRSTLNNAASLISAGRDVDITTTGGIINDASHISAGRDINLSGGSLDNIGYAVQHAFYVTCKAFYGCSWTSQSDPAFKGGSTSAVRHKKKFGLITVGHYWTAAPQPKEKWGSSETYYGPTGTIVAKDNITGTFTGTINNQTEIANASSSEYTSYTGETPGGLSPVAAASSASGVAADAALNGGATAALADVSTGVAGAAGTRSSAAAPATTGGTLAYQGVETAQVKASATAQEAAMTLPGFATSSDPTIPTVISAIPGGSALFIADPDPSAHYLIETNPKYATFSGFYGSQYLVNRLGDNTADYEFLGDSYFDTEFIQQQIVASTGQTFLGSSYETANEQMELLLDNAVSESNALDLTFGAALTASQQAALTQNIVWYVPETVDGRSVLAPKLYLAPGQATLTDGAEISATNVSLTGSSINNTGTINASNALSLTATSGDIVNAGGTLSGGSVALAALNGSVVNEDQLNTFMVDGGKAQSLGAQGTITSGGDAQIYAAKNITFDGGSLSALGDTTLVAGQGITLGSVAASASQDIEQHDYSHRAAETENFGASVSTGGNLTAAALGGDLTLAGATVAAGKSATLMATGNVNLNAVTDSQSSYTRTVEHGFLNRTTTTSSESSTDQVGSTVAANDNVTMVSGGDMSVAGTVAGGGNVTLQAGGTFTENALKDTANAFYEQKSSGLFLGTSGASAKIGFGKTTDTDTYSQTSWTPSGIASTGGNLSITANGPVTINASDVGAAKDATVTGSSVSFNALEDVATQTQTHKSLFIGNTTGLDPNSVVGQMVDIALSASQASGKDSGKLAAMDGAQAAMTGVSTGVMASMKGGVTQVKSLSSLFEEGKTPKGNIDLIAVKSNIGFDLEKSSTTVTNTTAEGSTAAAGNTLAVTASGNTPTDSRSGDIVATASQLSGQDVTLTAPGQVTLQAGYDTTHEVASSKSISASVGASASIGTKGAGVSIEGQFGFSKTNTNAASSTAVDSTVSGTDNVTIANATGTTTLNGAEISGKSIDVATKDLTITTAQDTSGYNSKTTGIDASFSVPVWGAGDIGGSASFSHTTVKDSYASTEATQSGLYAGSGGLDVTASGTTTLNGGVIESTAAAALNQLSTGTLVANDIANHADATAKTMGYQANVMNPEGATGGGTGGTMTAIGAGMAANAGGLLGAATRKDASSVTQSAIGSNVQIAAGSTNGDLSRSPSTSSHPLTNTFDAQQMQNDLQIQQVGSQVVGQVGGMVSDSLAASGLDAFKEGGYSRVLLETAGNAGIAALGHGSIGGSALATSAAGFGNLVTLPAAAGIAEAIAPNDRDAQYAIANTIETAASAGLGAAGGAVGGNSSVDALSGAGFASNVAQYNSEAAIAQYIGTGASIGAIVADILAPVAVTYGLPLALVGVVAGGAYYEWEHYADASHDVDINASHTEERDSYGSDRNLEVESNKVSTKTAAPATPPEDPEPDDKTTKKLEFNDNIKFDSRQLQKKFKHASDFGVKGNYTPENSARFEEALRSHISNSRKIQGLYRGKQQVVNYFNPENGLNVMTKTDGTFISGWRLTQPQIENILRSGNL
ncbi:filamentous hemagglutinin [Komagataeibacter europaeus]|uniref:Filamentous hemagglutinin n=1 Tax=Komagataeibacter europaeus TaxID=33995 RepID=A0A0M0EDD3_KOMEU|nr:hemagglutinin repeat-containing protein [Komagataeibacter europaeus]KON63250.1 filamentous hemagglutinin [Komagataeibacter europaeus]